MYKKCRKVKSTKNGIHCDGRRTVGEAELVGISKPIAQQPYIGLYIDTNMQPIIKQWQVYACLPELVSDLFVRPIR